MNSIGECGVGNGFCSEDVVLYGGLWVVFHQRDVLVGCGVKDDLGTIFVHDTAKGDFVEDITHEVTNLLLGQRSLGELLFDGKDSELGLVVDQKEFGVQIEQLTAQLAADTARTSRDQNPSSGDGFLDRSDVEAVGFSTQQVRNRDITSCQTESSGDHLLDGGDDVDFDVRCGTLTQDGTDHSPRVAARDQQVMSLRLRVNAGPPLAGVVDLNAGDERGVPVGGFRDKADDAKRLVSRVHRGEHLVDADRLRIDTIDQRSIARIRIQNRTEYLVPRPVSESNHRQQKQAQYRVRQ